MRSFDLRAVAPPVPAMKYQLLFDDLGERRPGNAAILYMQAILLLESDTKEKTEKALAAYDAKDMKTFESLAGALELPNVFDELELAGRREYCDWEPPFRERGAYTLLPHLAPLAHQITRLVKIRTLRQIQQDKVDDALGTLRLGYEMSDKVGREPVLISLLVSLAITSQMNEALATLMDHPQAPNLYWALAGYPQRLPIYRHAMQGERSWIIPSVPNLVRVKNGEELTAQEWRELFDHAWRVHATDSGNDAAKTPRDPVKATSKDLLHRAQDQYVQTHRLPIEQVAQIDPMIVLGEFYFWQYEIAFDDMYKLKSLPYPQLLPKAREQSHQVTRLRAEQPGNPFQVFAVEPVIKRFAYVDRQLAALTAVEAIRSYAAANDGRLPAKLEDITATPVPENPVTGQPFEYVADAEKATLADAKFDPPLRYTIKIRN
jgi:hypothetical protein